jgi:tape measure domain-containing protein
VAKGDLTFKIDAQTDVSELNRLFKELTSGAQDAKRALNEALGGSVTKELVVEIKANKSGIPQIIAQEKERLGAVDAIAAKLRQVNELEKGSLTSLRQQVNQAKQARDQITKFATQVGVLGGKVTALNPKWAAQAKRVAELQLALDRASASGFWDKLKVGFKAQGIVNFFNGLNQLTTSLQSASIIVGQLTGSVNTLIRTKAELQAFALSFRAIGIGGGAAQAALKDVERIAIGLGTRINVVQDGFQQLAPVVLNTGGTLQDVSAIIEAMSSRFAAFDIAGDRARRIMNGIIQAFAKGKLQAEELTQQISEAEPAFKTDFAQALGVTIAELEKLVQAGEITTDVLIETIPKLSKASLVYGKLGTSASEAADALEKGNATIDQVRDNIFNFNQLSLRRLALGLEPAIVAFIRLQAVVTDFVTDLTKLDALGGVSSLITGVVSAFGSALSATAALAKAFLTVLDPLAKLAGFLLSIPGAAEAFGFAIIGKAVISLTTLKKGLVGSTSDLNTFGKVVKGAVDWKTFVSGIRSVGDGLRGTNREIFKTETLIKSLGNRQEALRGRITGVSAEIAGLQKRLTGLQSATSTSLGSGAIQKQSEEIQSKIRSLQNELAGYQKALTNTESRSTQAASKLVELGESARTSSSAFGRASGVFKGAVGIVSSGINGIAAASRSLVKIIGPIGLALGAFSVLQSAYTKAAGETNKINQETRETIEALSGVIRDLGGSVDQARSKLEGWPLLWERFSLGVFGAVEALQGFGATLLGNTKNAIDSNTEGVGRFISVLGELTKSLIAGGVAGAALAGGLLGLKFGPIGAGVGAIVAVILSLTGAGNDADVSLQKTIKASNALGAGIRATATSVTSTVNALKKFTAGVDENKSKLEELRKERQKFLDQNLDQEGREFTEKLEEYDQAIAALETEIRLDTKKAEEGLSQVNQAIKAIDQQLKALEGRRDFSVAEAADLRDSIGPGLDEILKQQTKVNALQERYNSLLKKVPLSNEQSKELREVGKQLDVELKALEEAIKRTGVDPADVESYKKLQDEIITLNRQIKISEELAKQAKEQYDQWASSFGALTTAQKETVSTISSLDEELKNLRQSLSENYNPDVTPDRWREVSAEIAVTAVNLQRLQDSAAGFEAIYTAAVIKAGVTTGALADSVENANREVQALNTVKGLIDVNAPELKGVLRDLEDAQLRLEQLNGKTATINIALIEERIASGGPVTIGTLDRYIESLGQLKLSIPIGSPDADEVIQKIERAQQVTDLGSKSSADLKKQLLENEKAGIDDRYSLEQAKIQLSLNRSNAASEERKRRIQSESQATSAYYDRVIAGINRAKAAAAAASSARVASLQQLTGGEQELARLQEKELRRQARSGATPLERASARAQLERADRDRQIAAEQERAAEVQARLEEKAARLAEEKARKEEEAQEKIKKIDEERRKEQEAAAAATAEYQQKSLEFQERSLRLAEQERAEQNAIIREILAAREGEGSGVAESILGSKSDLDAIVNSYIAVATQAGEAATQGSELNTAMIDSGGAAEQASGIISDQMVPGLEDASDQVTNISDKLRALDGLVVTVRINSVGGGENEFAGGPVSGGTTYTVNELGKEAFLSASGRLSMINAPAWGQWRAPSSGTIIPAHLTKQLDIPRGGVQTTAKPTVASPGTGGLGRVVRAIQASLNAPRLSDPALGELANAQAHQATQIGKLSRAVDGLARKDWNVNVGVKTNGGTAYLDELNRRL